MTPSNWSSGTVDHSGRAITKEGPAVLRLAFYQAANVARGLDRNWPSPTTGSWWPTGTATQATVAVARKLIERTWTVLTREQPYELRDVDRAPVTARGQRDHRRQVGGPPARARTLTGTQRRHPPSQARSLTRGAEHATPWSRRHVGTGPGRRLRARDRSWQRSHSEPKVAGELW
jgi:hypothetical protein